MLIAVAWRNIWRSRVRSLVILLALVIGMAAGVFSSGFMLGIMNQRIETAISSELGHIQVHNRDYLKNRELAGFISNADAIAVEIDTVSGVNAVSCRLISEAMINSAGAGSGVRLMGIDAADEMQVSDLHTRLVEGNYFDTDKRNPLVIGQTLAHKLDARLNSKLVLTFQDADGNLTHAAFRVTGIYKTSNSAYDELNVFVRRSDLAALLLLEPAAAHEIVVSLDDNSFLEPVEARLSTQLPQHEVSTWKALQPDLNYMVENMDVSMYTFIIVILAGLLFGIVNTMLMAILERTRELGMLMAVGMNKLRVFFMIMLESVMISLTGGVLGIGVGAGLTAFWGWKGLDLSAYGQALESFGYDTVVYPVVDPAYLLKVAFLVVMTGIAASVYPVFKALKLKPAEAIRTE